MDLDEAKRLQAKVRRDSMERRVDELLEPVLAAYDQTHRGITRAHRARRERFELRARAALIPLVTSWVDMVESEWTE